MISGIAEFKHPEHMAAFHTKLIDTQLTWEQQLDRLPGVRCLPLGVILGALDAFHISFFVLDVEGAEMSILTSLDWTRFSFDVLAIERQYSGEHNSTTTLHNSRTTLHNSRTTTPSKASFLPGNITCGKESATKKCSTRRRRRRRPPKRKLVRAQGVSSVFAAPLTAQAKRCVSGYDTHAPAHMRWRPASVPGAIKVVSTKQTHQK